jgi:hypothetical protein
MKINILLAFDHELPLGGIYKSLEESIFDPTYKLIETAKAVDVPVNLFSDIFSAVRMKELGYIDFYNKFVEQLAYSIRNGHDIQLHIHPHWLETNFNGQKFIHTDKFRLADYKDDKRFGGIEGIVEKGITFLNDICSQYNNDYKCIAYRAGGFNLYPETQSIFQALYNGGIRIESSINPGFFYKSGLSYVNYKNVPNKSNWFLDLNGQLNKEAEKGLLEIIIAGKPAGLITNTKHIILKRVYKKSMFSTGYSIHSGKSKLSDKLKFVFSTRMLGFDIITLSSNDLMKILDYNVKKFKTEDVICLSTLSHPKNMGPHHMSLMKEFIEKARNKYKNDITFTTYQRIFDQFRLN